MLASCVLFCLFAALPSLAAADVQTIDFDSGALNSPLDAQGDISFPKELGFRPYLREVGSSLAHSGSNVGDLGRCLAESRDAQECEFFHAGTTGVLARSAKSVTLYAGRFGPIGPGDPGEQVTLTAFDVAGHQLDRAGPIPIDASGFNQRLSVASATGDIASFRVEATSGQNGESGGDLGIDDLSVDFAEGGAPDFSISTTNQVVALVQGQSTQVPLRISRLNGSNGPIEVTVSGLPEGVSAAPLTVPGSQSDATLTLSADPSAPDTHFVPSEATTTADPHGDADVGAAPRTTTLGVRVASDFGLSVNGISDSTLSPGSFVSVQVPDCAAVDVPVKISRDIAMDRDVSLSVHDYGSGSGGLPQGVSAEILPSPVVPASGGLLAERTLRLRVDSSAAMAEFGGPVVPSGGTAGAALTEFGIPIVLSGTVGSGPNARTRQLPLNLLRARPSATAATSAPRSGLAYTPRFGHPGTPVRIHGTGFCPNTMVEVGNNASKVETTLVDDHTIEFNTPRYALSGPVTIIPPGEHLKSYQTDDSLSVDSVRNSDGFQFRNYGFGSLSLGEMVRAFGADDLFSKVNPCWPLGHCSVSTGVLDPIAAIDWSVLNIALRRSKGHCFGISLASQELVSGKEPLRQFAGSSSSSPPTEVYDLRGPNAPSGELADFLDAEHAKQGSDELISAWADRAKSLQAQIDTLEREFSHHREPLISIMHGSSGHNMLAYDMTQTANTATIYVYDSALPFTPYESVEAPEAHPFLVDEGSIEIDKVRRTWSSPHKNWTGGDHGTLWVIPNGSVPDDPSLPGLETLRDFLTSITFGSTDGSVRTEAISPGAEFKPMLGGAAAGGDAGTWASDDANAPLRVAFEGVKSGSYSQAYAAPGFVASANDVPIEKGSRDSIAGDRDSLTFDSGEARPLEVQLARREDPAMTVAATLDTHSSANGSDTTGFDERGALTYAHRGAPTTASFSLTALRRDGGPATFVSGPIAIGRDERWRVKPLDRGLRHVLLTIRRGDGSTTTRTLRNRGHGHGRLELGAPRVSHRRLSMRLGLHGLHGRTIVGVTLRLVRDGRLIAHKAVALTGAAEAREVGWRLPAKVGKGRYRLLADVRALTTGGRGSTAAGGGVTAHRAARIFVDP